MWLGRPLAAPRTSEIRSADYRGGCGNWGARKRRKSAAQDSLLNVKFAAGDAHQLSFKDGEFEAVVCQTLLTHVRDAEEVVREMARVLKPGCVHGGGAYGVGRMVGL
jgi:ubiquinone/menaquinone biosynthesis C-methylase UbiE